MNVVVMVRVAARASNCLSQVLGVRQRVILGRIREVARELIELSGLHRVTFGSRGIGRVLQVCRDPRCHLRVFGRVGLL